MHAAETKARVIVHTPEPGAGAGEYAAEFVRALAHTGVPVTLFCPGNFAYEENLEGSGVAVVHAPIRDVGTASLPSRVIRNLQFAAGSAGRFWATVRKGDIVHFQFALHLGLGLLYFFVARLKGAAIVLTVHDPLPHRWILPSSFRGIEKWLLRFQYRLCSRLIVHNETGRRVLRESFGLEYGSIAVIPHGPLNPIEARKVNQQAPAAAEPLRLLAFGSLRENKGLHLSIAAVQRLRQEAANRPIILTIAGALPNLRERPYWERCLRLIAEQPEGIEVRERRIGDGEVTELFAAAGAILLPYVDFYSDSGVAMLALSQGRPILATAAGGLGELLQQAHCGILIDAPTVDAVAAAIQKMASLLPEVLRRMGLNGHSHVLTQRSWRTIAERTREVYEEVVPELGASEEAMKLARACHE